MPSVVFDASAILALLRDETGSEIVAEHIGDGIMSAVNFQEVLKALLSSGIQIEPAIAMLEALHLDIRAHGERDAIEAAHLFDATKDFGSGLGDRTCVALAISAGLPALTADRAWAHLDVPGFQVKLIR